MKVLGWAAAVTGFSVVTYPLIAYLYPKDLAETPAEPVRIGSPEELPPGAAKTVPYGRYPALVIHTEKGLRAYSAVCTHFACLVKWNSEHAYIECPCHEAIFDAEDGSVVAGPPPAPLEPIAVYTAEDGLIYIGEEES